MATDSDDNANVESVQGEPRPGATLLDIIRSRASPFRDLSGQPYLTLMVKDHEEHHRVTSSAVRSWLYRTLHDLTGARPTNSELDSCIKELEGIACFESPTHPVFVRLAATESGVYLDLGGDTWRVACVTADGWNVIANPPVRFRRPRGLLPLPEPTRGGSIESLRRFLNIHDEHFPLVVSWVIGALSAGPHVVLALIADHGCSKSTTQRVLRRLIDPNVSELRTQPRDERDLMIAAGNAHVLSFDNLSKIHPWFSDALCRLATGGGFATRQLYTDDTEILLDARRPVILNSIEAVIDRPDLLDRSIVLRLPSLSDAHRKPERTFWAEYEKAWPGILGALLDAVSMALRHRHQVVLDHHPRMADFAEWVNAAEAALPWRQGTFLRAYEANRAGAIEELLDEDSIAEVIKQLASTCWTGTATDLSDAINGHLGRQQFKGQHAGRRASGALRRLEPALLQAGVEVVRGRRTGRSGTRLLTIMS